MSMLKVFDMMAGGIEFNHYFVEKNIPMPDLARFIVFTFIIVMSLSFMNLLVSKCTQISFVNSFNALLWPFLAVFRRLRVHL